MMGQAMSNSPCVERPVSGSYAAVRRGGLAVMAALVLSANMLSPAKAEIDVRTFDPPKVLGAFSLKDHNKQSFGLDRLKGRWSLVLLGYTHCPDVCPFTLTNLAHVIEQLKSQMRPDSLPQVIFVGVDPDRDAAVLAKYMPHFDPDFLGVTGAWPEITKVVESLDGFVRIMKKSKDDEGYAVRHSSRISLIDPQGRIVAQINPPMPPSETAMFIAKTIRTYRKQAKRRGN